jgi:acyl-coenzyme A synthetase/AMP-(fatty) acid ligase
MNDELALLLTTSGSTGSPKFVRQSYKNIRANTKSIVQYLEIDESERPITTLPMSYTYGLSIINSHLWMGASIILTQKTLMRKEFWRQFEDFGATSFGGVPYVYEMLDKLRFFRMELPLLRTMTQAGGKLSPELHKKFAEYAKANGKRFVVMYGHTEATARMSYLPYEKSLEKCGSVGIAVPGGEFSLIDIDGNEIAGSEVAGELVYKGDNVMLGYAESGDDLIKGDENGGILVTGDMAKRDADGYYCIVGRKKRFLKIFGSRVNLDETERILRAAFPDCDCACTGVDDKMTVCITDDTAKAGILQYLAEKTGLNRLAFDFIVINRIPRNEAGKILYSELEQII